MDSPHSQQPQLPLDYMQTDAAMLYMPGLAQNNAAFTGNRALAFRHNAVPYMMNVSAQDCQTGPFDFHPSQETV